jgi:uncharacterized protein YjiS (DUF1127 family)
MAGKELTAPSGHASAPNILQGCLAESPLPRRGKRAYLRSVTSEQERTEGTKMNTDRITKAYRTWRDYRHAYKDLMRLSDRDLDDIGVRRGNIPALARAYALR